MSSPPHHWVLLSLTSDTKDSYMRTAKLIIIVCTACYSPLKFILYPLVLCCVWLFGWLRHVMMCMYAYFIHVLWCVCILSLPLVLSSVSGYTLSTHYCNCKKIANPSLFTDGAVRSSLFETYTCVPDRIGIWKRSFLRKGENWSTWRKISWRKGETQQQTQPTYGVDTKIPTRATLVGMGALTTAQPLLPEYSHEDGCYTILSLVTIYMHCYSTSC